MAVVVEHQVPGHGEGAGLLLLTGGVMLSVRSKPQLILLPDSSYMHFFARPVW